MNTTNTLQNFKNYLRIRDYSILYTSPIKLYLDYCTQEGIDYLTVDYNQMSNFILKLKDASKANGYINNFLKALRCFYTYLNESGVALVSDEVKNIAFTFRLLAVEQKIKDYLSIEEVNNLISKAITYQYSVSPECVKALLWFMFFTGVRRNELLNLKRKDINLSERQALIRIPTKNKKENIVYFPKRVADALQEYFLVEEERTNTFNMSRGKMAHLFVFLKNFVP